MRSAPQQQERRECGQSERGRGASQRKTQSLAAKGRHFGALEVTRLTLATHEPHADQIVCGGLVVRIQFGHANRALGRGGVAPPQKADEPSFALQPSRDRETAQRDQDQKGRSEKAATQKQMRLRWPPSASV
jgi:hypothetical protein